MKERENSNLPSTEVKKMHFIDYLKRIINSGKEIKKVDEIVDRLSKIKEYDVLSMPAFKQIVGNKIENNKNGIIIMSDINNLYEANRFASKEIVNKDIKILIEKMKKKIVSKGSNEFDIGKLGDEIYLYLPHMKEDKAKELLDEFRSIKVNLLSISCGLTSNLENGIESAMDQAEECMSKDKSQYKYKKLMKFCNGDINRIIDYSIEKELGKARIDLHELKSKSERMKFVNIYERVVNNVSINDLINNIKQDKSEEDIIKNDKSIKLKQKYVREANVRLGNVSEKIKEKYILAQFLSKSLAKNTVTNEYFENFERDKLKGKKNFELMAVDISGLKFVNDEYGHSEGDNEIQKVLENISDSLKEMNIKQITNIVVKNAGNAFVVLPKMKKEKKDALINKVTSIESKLDVLCVIKGKEDLEKSSNQEDGLEIFKKLRITAEKSLYEESTKRKVTDEKNVERLISGIYKSILDNEIIRNVIENDPDIRNKILKNIDSRFDKIVNEDNSKSQVVYLENIDRENILKNKKVKEKSKEKSKEKVL
jgi:GGDEF domain-containing protein